MTYGDVAEYAGTGRPASSAGCWPWTTARCRGTGCCAPTAAWPSTCTPSSGNGCSPRACASAATGSICRIPLGRQALTWTATGVAVRYIVRSLGKIVAHQPVEQDRLGVGSGVLDAEEVGDTIEVVWGQAGVGIRADQQHIRLRADVADLVRDDRDVVVGPDQRPSGRDDALCGRQLPPDPAGAGSTPVRPRSGSRGSPSVGARSVIAAVAPGRMPAALRRPRIRSTRGRSRAPAARRRSAAPSGRCRGSRPRTTRWTHASRRPRAAHRTARQRIDDAVDVEQPHRTGAGRRSWHDPDGYWTVHAVPPGDQPPSGSTSFDGRLRAR